MFAFAGLVIFWISEDWVLVGLPIDLLPLNGDHSGRASGKLIYKSLDRRGLAHLLRMSMFICCRVLLTS